MQNKGYPQEFIDRVRDASNIVEIARSYLPLKQKGQDFWACCPFHHEKTPSFALSGPKQFYYCYGCHESGNVFNLVMKMENLSWIEAVEMLAKKANIELPKTEVNGEWLKERRKKEKIYEALILARDHYCRTLRLPQNKAALDYLHQRGIDDDLINLFHIGYSDSWQGVVDELKQHGISEQTMKEAGIVAANPNGRVWDAQFERITFSIHDVYGNCIGFTGRTMKTDPNLAKYKNTAETPVFNKSNIVYGVDVMKEKTRGQHIDGLIVVEGNVDEIAMIKHGFHNTVACMGTALTKFHAGVISRFGKVVYLCLDGDNAGQHAALKSIDVLESAGLLVKVVTFPDNQDPDEFLSTHGAKAMQDLLANSMGGMEFKLDYIKRHSDLSNKVGKTQYLNEVVALLVKLDNDAERELYFKDVAQAVGITVEALSNTIKNRVPRNNSEKRENTISGHHSAIQKPKLASKNNDSVHDAERVVVKGILHNKEYAKVDLNELPTFSNEVYQKIITQGLKINEIDDKLEANELQQISDLRADDRDSSVEEQIKNWQESIMVLKIHKVEQAIEATRDNLQKNNELIKEREQLRKEQRILRQKNKN